MSVLATFSAASIRGWQGFSGNVGWSQVAYFTPDLGDVRYLGKAVTVSGDAKWAAAASETFTTTGRCYIYANNAGTWTTDAVISGSFGALSMDSTGTRLLGGRDNSAWIYVRSGNTWSIESELPATGNNIFYGTYLDLDRSGSTAVVSQVDNASLAIESVRVWTRSGNNWSLLQTIALANNTVSGEALSLSGNGNRIVVKNGDAVLNIYTRTTTFNSAGTYNVGSSESAQNFDGTQTVTGYWDGSERAFGTINQTLTVPGTRGGEEVTINDNGDVVLWTNPGLTISPGNTILGNAFIYRSNGSAFVVNASFRGNNTVAGDYFGGAADMDATGDTVIIGAQHVDTAPYTDAGAVYIFSRK